MREREKGGGVTGLLFTMFVFLLGLGGTILFFHDPISRIHHVTSTNSSFNPLQCLILCFDGTSSIIDTTTTSFYIRFGGCFTIGGDRMFVIVVTRL